MERKKIESLNDKIMLNYYIAITLGPTIIVGLNFLLREQKYSTLHRVVYSGIDSCIHLIFYSFFLGELGLSSKFDSGWAFWTVLYFAIIGLVILVPTGIYLRWFKKSKTR